MVKHDQMHTLHMYEIRLCPRSMLSYHVTVSNSKYVPFFADSGEVDALGKSWTQKSTGLVPY